MTELLTTLVFLAVALAINHYLTERTLERTKKAWINAALDHDGIRRWEYNELVSKTRILEREVERWALKARDTSLL